MALGLNAFDGSKYITGASLVTISGLKNLDHTPSNGPRNGFVRIKVITPAQYKQQVH